ncbi:hypothetical protein A3A67_04955 [Candidatus Peribacteria bacterium RIFCSPLOWO2_01_FULL_51_18]|nr:MAG: hypothetical protein A3C52_03650 [Candidatus Peribacteria bacterium RIFCSPHIGHO2_02_FULL_51_15]OGJ65519.1 MAG: hypothetical protein A3A67_04955 [Candidatus Peribacteria bacterium RIFCSPLOWO2_01_FULL_51_18]OGJ69385.1 MAG: hypothetical protein A3J34_04200 [Candidatus Peribacteria bacterium RIFCSPLOWO2_02_FULL_51_10]
MIYDPKSQANDEKLLNDLLDQRTETVHPDKKFRQIMRLRIRQWIHGEPVSARSRFFHFTRIWIGATCAFLIAVTGVVSYSYASPYVGRDNKLYFLKRFVETVELKTAVTPEKQAETYLKFSDRRSDEAKAMKDKGVWDFESLDEMTDDLSQAASAAKTLPPSGKRNALEHKLKERVKEETENLSKIIKGGEEPETDRVSPEGENTPEPLMFAVPKEPEEAQRDLKSTGAESAQPMMLSLPGAQSGTGSVVGSGAVVPKQENEEKQEIRNLKEQLRRLKKVEDELAK